MEKGKRGQKDATLIGSYGRIEWGEKFGEKNKDCEDTATLAV